MEDDYRSLPERLKAETESVDDLVLRVMRGQVRTPQFQRGLRWGSSEVLNLFDSILRGYPIGAFLFYRANAKAAKVRVGPLTVDAPETGTALWTVDGQQRITALAVSLSRPLPLPNNPASDDPWVVYYDPKEDRFSSTPDSGLIPSTFVPLPALGDSSKLQDFVFSWQHGKNEDLRRRLFDAGRRLREYRVPYYVVATSDDKLLREIFYRINSYGKQLEWEEVYDALFGRPGTEPSSLDGLAIELSKLGVGKPSPRLVLRALVAMQGLDVTRSLDEHIKSDRDKLTGLISTGLPVLRRTLDFMRRKLEVPHLSLVPRSDSLLILARFLSVHPDPSYLVSDLLSRWFWRTVFGFPQLDDRTLLRRSIASISDDAEKSALELLKLAPEQATSQTDLAGTFDPRSSMGRLVGLALASLNPVHLETRVPLDIANVFEVNRTRAYQRIVSGSSPGFSGFANRLLHPPVRGGCTSMINRHVELFGTDSDCLRSHAVSLQAANQILNGNFGKFLELRRFDILSAIEALSSRRAQWGARSRPSIAYILDRYEGGI